MTELDHDAEDNPAHLAAILESASAVLISLTKDLSGSIRTWNRGAETVYGYTAREAVGRHISFLVPPERRGDIPYILGRVKKGQTVEQYETVRIRKDGIRIHISLNVFPIKDSDGAIVGASIVAFDITKYKGAEEELAKANAQKELILESAGDGIMAMDARGYQTLVNSSAVRILGYSVEEMIGKHSHEIWHHTRADGSPYPASEC